MAFRAASKSNVKLDGVGDHVELDVTDMSELRGQCDLEFGTFDVTTRLAFEFSCAREGGQWYEPTESTRLTAAGVSSAVIDCRGFSRARLRVVVQSGTAGSLVRLSLCAYAAAHW